MSRMTVVAFLALLALPWAAGAGKEPSKQTQEAVKVLKSDLGKFEVLLHTFDPRSPEANKVWVQLVTDPKKVPDEGPKQTFLITEKQATALIDHLARAGLFDRVHRDPPGIPVPGWYVAVRGGPASARVGYWRYDLDVKPASVGVIRHLTGSLEGDARAAVERFRRDEAKPKR